MEKITYPDFKSQRIPNREESHDIIESLDSSLLVSIHPVQLLAPRASFISTEIIWFPPSIPSPQHSQQAPQSQAASFCGGCHLRLVPETQPQSPVLFWEQTSGEASSLPTSCLFKLTRNSCPGAVGNCGTLSIQAPLFPCVQSVVEVKLKVKLTPLSLCLSTTAVQGRQG